MRTDPRIRQSLNRISTSIESASDNALTSCFTFTKSYLDPCLISLSTCCIINNDRNHRRDRREYPFGFYDYDDDEHGSSSAGGFLGWGNDELDRLLAGGGSGGGYGGNSNRMTYGASSSSGAIVGSGSAGKRKSVPGNDQDPTVIPQTSMFGFLTRWAPFRGKGLRYKPSAANLQEHPHRGNGLSAVQEEAEDDHGSRTTGMRRKRSATGSSGDSVGGSMRSRGDLWPSEDDDDAIPIGDDVFLTGSDGEEDEFLVLARREHRNKNAEEEEELGSVETIGPGRPGPVDDEVLRREEEEVRILEEEELEKKREAAKRLAVQRGLSTEDYAGLLSRSQQEINPSAVPLPETLPSTRAPSLVEQLDCFEPPMPLAPISSQQAYFEPSQSLPHAITSTPITRTSSPAIRDSIPTSVGSRTPIQIRKEKEILEIPTMIILMPNSERELVKEINEAANSGVVIGDV
ncbi:hypothetical protein P167DRAFT_572495 [Morchella conica CCBAS932]|uniref:Uncharacterized protein n=1 Tax=Morchella conica CCBAS932 TaxID=1392247 RepID=A0A3N4KUU1_9PEZI|nr:hypothetical protein P167DRAFT_572495 [Morchella conica CCBAS932]